MLISAVFLLHPLVLSVRLLHPLTHLPRCLCLSQWLPVRRCSVGCYEKCNSADKWKETKTGEHRQNRSVAGLCTGLGGAMGHLLFLDRHDDKYIRQYVYLWIDGNFGMYLCVCVWVGGFRVKMSWIGALSWCTLESCPGSISLMGGAKHVSSSCLTIRWSSARRWEKKESETNIKCRTFKKKNQKKGSNIIAKQMAERKDLKQKWRKKETKKERGKF